MTFGVGPSLPASNIASDIGNYRDEMVLDVRIGISNFVLFLVSVFSLHCLSFEYKQIHY